MVKEDKYLRVLSVDYKQKLFNLTNIVTKDYDLKQIKELKKIYDNVYITYFYCKEYGYDNLNLAIQDYINYKIYSKFKDSGIFVEFDINNYEENKN